MLQKLHYDQAQRMLLSTFTAGLSANPGQQVRFQIAIAVSEAEAQEERNLAFFFRILEPKEKVGATLVSPERPLEDHSTDRLPILTQTRRK